MLSLSTIRYDPLEQAVTIANDTECGLAAGAWTTDIPRALEIASEGRGKGLFAFWLRR